jgi:hypothetical protein
LGLLKPQAHTMQVMATLRCILDRSADHMPHRSQILVFGEKVVLKVLRAMWKRKQSILEINTINSVFKLKNVLLSKLSKIWKLNFPEYDVKKLGDNFSRCSTCNRLHTLRKAII